jgi:putative transport protein
MATWFVGMLRQHPELALFLTLALGYAIGKLRLGSITLGSVVGVLIAGVLVGQLGVKVSSDLKTAFFLLFLFAIGYRTGPQFFSGLKSSGFPQIALTVVFCVSALALTYGAARTLGYDAGTAGGLMGGTTTESATVGTATDAIQRLGLDPARTQELLSNIAVAFAVTYFLAVLTNIGFLSRVAPRILGVDLAAECAALEKSMGLMDESATATGYRTFALRAYRAEGDGFVGKSVGSVERACFERGQRLLLPRLRRGDAVIDTTAETVIGRGDVLAVAGRTALVIAAQAAIGPEVDDKPLLDVEVEAVDVVITEKAVVGLTLGELVRKTGPELLRGVGVRKIVRAGAELPLAAGTRLARGDVVTLVGILRDAERVAVLLGYVDRPTNITEMALVGVAVFLGGVIGIPALRVRGLEVGLSESVGVLLGGLILGWLRSVDRRIPRLPDAVVTLFDSLGLTAFLAVTALAAGPDFVRGLQQSGVSLLVAGLVIVILPQLLTLLTGKFVFRMHPGILLGVCCGAGTSAPALAAVQEVAKSKVPTLGYGVTYALGNVLLALWGSVIVALVHR